MTRSFGNDGSPFSVTKLRTLDNAHDNEGVISGCAGSTGTNSFDTDVASGTVNINGSRVSVSSATVSHSTSGSEDRIDLVTVDSSDTKNVVEGSQASTSGQPNAPDIPADEVVLYLVEVRGGSSEILSGDIFNEYKTIKAEIEDFTTAGSDGQVPVAQSDGSLQMGTGTEWTEDGNSPDSTTNTGSYTYTISDTFDIYKVTIDVADNGGNQSQLSLRANGDSGNNYIDTTITGGQDTSASEVKRVLLLKSNESQENVVFKMRGRWDGRWSYWAQLSDASGNTTQAGENGNITSPLDSFELFRSNNFDINSIEVKGRDF